MATPTAAIAPNPYTPILLTYDSKHFYGRESELSSILQVITAPIPNGHAIYGIRTIGKTTLFRFLMDTNGAIKRYESYVRTEFRPGGGKRLLFVMLNFHIYRQGDNIFYKMLTELEEILIRHDLLEEVPIPAYSADQTHQDLAQILRRALIRLSASGQRVVYLFDDFDAPLIDLSSHEDGLLRSLCEYAALLIATEDPMEDLRPDLHDVSPLLQILHPTKIGLLQETAARELICDPIKRIGVSFTESIQTFLLDVGGLHPFLLAATCELYYEMYSQYPEIDQQIHDDENRPQFQNQFIFRLLGQIHVSRVLQSTWGRLRPEDHRTLYSIASHITIDVSGERGAIVLRLTNKGLIYWDVRHRVNRISGELLRSFVLKNYAPDDERTLLVTVPASNDIFSDLTPLDRNLLTYFLNHQDRVCTFDELLDAVWKDGEKSKRALEAAVHRLRKTLGEDYIINVRGKGYKFVPEGITQPFPLMRVGV